jgi:O-antigen ligase
LGFEKAAISSMYLIRFTFYSLLYFVFKEFDPAFKRKASYVLLFSGFVTVLIGYIQFFLYPSLRNLYYLGWDEHLYRMFGTFLDPNFAGAFYALFFIFSLTFLRDFLEKENYIKKILFTFISLSALGAVFLTYSRSALVMLFVSLFSFLILVKQKKLLLVFAGVIILLIALSPKSFQTEGTNILRVTSSQARLKTVDQALSIIKENYVYGVGFNAYRYAQNEKGLNNIEWKVTHSGAGTDNSFLFAAATTGIVGLFVFILLLLKLLKLGVVNLKKNDYSLALIAVTLGLIVCAFFINSLFYVLILEWIFLIAALTESK